MKSLIVLTIIVFVKAFGGMFLSMGMNKVGVVKIAYLMNLPALSALIQKIVYNPSIILAIFLMVLYFLLYLSSLSWLDLSYVLPVTTAGYILNTLLSWRFLGEQIHASRWIGTVLIMGGVLLVGLEKK